METFVARQPIFNIDRKVEFYELLFRNDQNNHYNSSVDGNSATLEVMASSFTLIGTSKLTNGKRAFINFTEELLLQEAPLMLPNDKIAVEILENVKPSQELVEVCRKLKSLGYILVLDDFVFKPNYESLLELVDFIKVDFLSANSIERKLTIEKCKNKDIKFIAEKIENVKDFNEAIELGYTYFQGYFFSKPTIMSSKELVVKKSTYFKLLKFLSKEYDLDDIERIIKTDIGLTYKLLKFINSAHFGLKVNIFSIRQAVVLLGKKELIKWATLLSLRNICGEGNEFIMEGIIIRAKLGEEIANILSLSNRASEIFIMEMFSNIDQLLNEPMEQILIDLPLEEDIKAALLGEDNIFSYINKLIICYEKADWSGLSDYAKKLNINELKIPGIYSDTVQWAYKILSVD